MRKILKICAHLQAGSVSSTAQSQDFQEQRSQQLVQSGTRMPGRSDDNSLPVEVLVFHVTARSILFEKHLLVSNKALFFIARKMTMKRTSSLDAKKR